MRKQTSLSQRSRQSPQKAEQRPARPELRRLRLHRILDALSAFLILAFLAGAPAGARAQEAEDAGDEEYYEGYDESDFEGGDLADSAAGLEDESGIYQLDNVTAETFEKMTSMERENAIMKLQIEQEKLRIDLEKQRAEKKKVALSLEDDERNRKIKIEDQEKKLTEERRKEKEAQDKVAAEAEKKKQADEVNRVIMEKVKSADLSNPDEVQAINQLMRLAGGSAESVGQLNVSNPGAAARKETPLEERFAIKSIMGAGGNLAANLENKEKGTTVKIRNGSDLDGWTVESIKNSSILLKKDGASKIMYLNQ